MAGIGGNSRDRCREKIIPYREAAEAILQKEKGKLALIKQGKTDPPIGHLALSSLMLNLASCYLVQNSVSVSILGFRSEEALNGARKAIIKSIIYLESVVGVALDAPFSDYEWRHEPIKKVTPAERYLLARKIGLSIDTLENAYGDNTKWRWAFVDLEGRFAAAAKNLVNLRDSAANSDPRSPHYEATIFHLRLVRELLAHAANRYRQRYELSTKLIDDFQLGITFLSALKRLNLLIGVSYDAAVIKKKLDIWTSKLTTDMNKVAALKKN